MDRKYKVLIPILIILIFAIIVILLLLLNMTKEEEQENPSVGDVGEEIDYSSTEIHNVEDKIQYYTVRNCINNYLSYLNTDSSIYYIGGEMNTEMQQEYIYNLLSSEFIQEKSITISNLYNAIDTTNKDLIFIPLQMKVLEKEDVNKYIAYGIIQTTIDNEFQDEAYFIVNLDNKNKTFSIEPINRQYTSIEEIQIKNNNIQIRKNDDNSYTDQMTTYEYVTREYFILYKRLVMSKPEIIYNMMSKEYRSGRFGSLDNFEKYINDNREEIEKIDLRQYLVNNYDDYIEYVGKDQFGNLYIFSEYRKDQSLDIKLDTYTIATEKFINEYETAKEEKKVQMNIDKFIQMINRHDYITSYNCISQGFKNNYFKTQSEFENYIKNNFFDYNNFEFKNYEKKGSNIYVYKIQLTDLTGKVSELKEIDIIMKLNDNTDFEMSFSM